MNKSADISFAGDLETDKFSKILKVEEFKNVRFQVQGTTTDTPIGSISIQTTEETKKADEDVAHGVYGTGSETAKWVTCTLPVGSVHGLAAGQAFAGPSEVITWNGATALSIWISLLDAGSYARLKWDNTSAGSGTGATMIIRGAGRSR